MPLGRTGMSHTTGVVAFGTTFLALATGLAIYAAVRQQETRYKTALAEAALARLNASTTASTTTSSTTFSMAPATTSVTTEDKSVETQPFRVQMSRMPWVRQTWNTEVEVRPTEAIVVPSSAFPIISSRTTRGSESTLTVPSSSAAAWPPTGRAFQDAEILTSQKPSLLLTLFGDNNALRPTAPSQMIVLPRQSRRSLELQKANSQLLTPFLPTSSPSVTEIFALSNDSSVLAQAVPATIGLAIAMAVLVAILGIALIFQRHHFRAASRRQKRHQEQVKIAAIISEAVTATSTSSITPRSAQEHLFSDYASASSDDDFSFHGQQQINFIHHNQQQGLKTADHLRY